MFDIDKIIINFIHNQCYKLGISFGYGFKEGFLIYFICIVGPFISGGRKR